MIDRSPLSGCNLLSGEVALPLREGLVVERYPGFPDWHDLTNQGTEAFAEGWASLTRSVWTLCCGWAARWRMPGCIALRARPASG